MDKLFSVMSWNIEHYKADNPKRTESIAKKIKSKNVDVFAILEAEDIKILELMKQHFADFNFLITDGPENMEIVVGYRKDFFEQVIFTQKREFQIYNPKMRPGALLSVVKNNANYNLLFLHSDSGTDASAFGNRFKMLDKIESMAKALNKNTNNKQHLIVSGDLNTMGMFYPTGSKKDEKVQALTEIETTGKLMNKIGMKILSKSHDATWLSKPGGKSSNLDHVIATDFTQFVDISKTNKYEVLVEGWQGLSESDQKKYMETFSDHCYIYFEIKK